MTYASNDTVKLHGTTGLVPGDKIYLDFAATNDNNTLYVVQQVQAGGTMEIARFTADEALIANTGTTPTVFRSIPISTDTYLDVSADVVVQRRGGHPAHLFSRFAALMEML